MKDSRRIACVLGDLDLVRPLSLIGVRAVVIGPHDSPTRHSRFTTRFIAWDRSWIESEDLVEQMMAYASTQPERPVLFYQHDEHLLLVSRYRERLAQGFDFVIAEAALVEALADKQRFQALAERLQLPIPSATVLRASQGDPPPPRDALAFPLIVKPVTRADDAWHSLESHAKVVRVESYSELCDLWPRLVAARCDAIGQELVSGPETAVESYHVYVDREGETVAEFSGRKLRTRPPEYGMTTALTTSHAEDVIDLGRDIVKKLGLLGVAKVDFKRGRDGRLRLLEVNPRFNLWHHAGARAGVNIPALVWADLTGQQRPAASVARPGVRWCSVTDFRAAREAGLSLPRWGQWMVGCETREIAALHDPIPFLHLCASRLTKRVARRILLGMRPAG